MEDRSNELNVIRHGSVLEIQLNRPKVNAIDFELSRRINEVVVLLRDDPELRVGSSRRPEKRSSPPAGISRRWIVGSSS